MLLPLEEGRCACAKARYAAFQAVALLKGASALLLRLCVALRPARHAEHSPQVVVLGEEGLSCCSCPSRRRRGVRVRKHGTRPLRQWHRRDVRVHCCYDCVRLCGLHGTQSTHHRWWCLVRRARAVALAPRGGEVRVCDSTVRGLSGSGIAGRSECTTAAAVCGLAACSARRARTTGGGA